MHYIALHCITLHYITLHYITLHYIILHWLPIKHYNGSSQANLNKIQRIQNAHCQSTGLSSGSTVRCDACCCQTNPPTASQNSCVGRHPLPAQLHWLDISERVRFKLCVLARRCTHGSAPSYLSKYCVPVSSIAGRSHLRSAASGDLFIPATNTVTIGPRAFAVACPASWNSFPTELHDTSLSLMTFRKKLKTYLFKTSS